MFLLLLACTDFLFSTDDQSWINGRSMEFAADTGSEVVVHKRRKEWVSQAPGGADGVRWKNKYGYLAITAMGPFAVDGINEKGLSIGGLWMPTTMYEAIPKDKTYEALEISRAGDWILGNFATCKELLDGLDHVLIWGAKNAELGTIPPIHLSIHDATGHSLVIEFLDGKRVIHHNEVQVLTNYPTFDWMVTNLRNFVNVGAKNRPPLVFKGMTIDATGNGSGMLGIPGDWTPPSRFVRLFNFKEYATKPSDATGGVNLALHLLNTVDIPLGDIQDQRGAGDHTQWVVVKDLTHRKLYFRSYDNLDTQAIDLDSIDFSADEGSMPIASKTNFTNVTQRLIHSDSSIKS